MIVISLIKTNYSTAIGLLGKVFAIGPEDRGSIQGRIILKTQKMVLDASLINTQHYKVWIKNRMEQSKERNGALQHLGVVAIEKKAFRSPSITVASLTYNA